MDLKQLRYFIAVAEELHFGRAADRAHIAQSPLSRQIQQLEQSLGVTLFARTKRRVELTDAGRTFLPEAREVLMTAERARNAAIRAEAGQVGRLSLGFTNSAIYTELPRLLAAFRSQYPQVQLDLHDSMLTPAQIEAILHGQLDLGIVRPPVSSPDIALLPFVKQRMVLALPESHPLSKLKKIEVVKLAGEPLIAFARSLDSSLTHQIVRLCNDAGFHPNVVQEVGDIPSMIMLVSSGMGLALVPSSSENIKMKRVVFRPLIGTIQPLILALAWNRNVDSQLRTRFLEITKDCLAFTEG